MARTPTLTSLRLFLQVAGSRSFSETARAANLSQPALSRTIKLLEEDLGVRLFDRNSRNVHLTSAGAARLVIDVWLGIRSGIFDRIRQNDRSILCSE